MANTCCFEYPISAAHCFPSIYIDGHQEHCELEEDTAHQQQEAASQRCTHPQSPVSAMADWSLVESQKRQEVTPSASANTGSYKEVIDHYNSPRQWNDDPYDRDRLRRRNSIDRMSLLCLDSIFDKHCSDDYLEMEWSDEEDEEIAPVTVEDEDEEPRGLSFIIDECALPAVTMGCSDMSWSSLTSTLDRHHGIEPLTHAEGTQL